MVSPPERRLLLWHLWMCQQQLILATHGRPEPQRACPAVPNPQAGGCSGESQTRSPAPSGSGRHQAALHPCPQLPPQATCHKGLQERSVCPLSCLLPKTSCRSLAYGTMPWLQIHEPETYSQCSQHRHMKATALPTAINAWDKPPLSQQLPQGLQGGLRLIQLKQGPDAAGGGRNGVPWVQGLLACLECSPQPLHPLYVATSCLQAAACQLRATVRAAGDT